MRFFLTLALASLAALPASARDAALFETTQVLNAADVLPGELHRGAHHHVRPSVSNDGYINTYVIESDFGQFEVEGTSALRTRVQEIGALAQLDELSKTEVFAKAAIEAGLSPVNAIMDFTKNPVQTVKGIPGGISRMFKRYSRKARQGAEQTQEFIADTTSKDADGEEGDEKEQKDVQTTTKKLTESYFGVSGAERAWHQQLGTDPYTTNETLKAAIKSVAWADRLGRFGLSFASIPNIPGADVIGDTNDLVWSKDPYELEQYNRGILAAGGAGEDLIEQFFSNTHLTPTIQTALIAAVAQLDGVAGREAIVRRATEIESAAEARLVRDSVLLLVACHEERPLDNIVASTALPSGIDSKGNAIAPVGIDYLIWTEAAAAAADRYAQDLAGAGQIELVIAGGISSRATEELEARGWKIRLIAD